MKIFKKINDIKAFLEIKRQQNISIGFLPTMGALHPGHLSLLAQCQNTAQLSVASIFVNPTQFNSAGDLEKYPRTIAQDIEALYTAGCNVLFYPDVAKMYPSGEMTTFYDLGTLEKIFEGVFRPGHFQGVCQVVNKLFHIIQPHHVFFGQKDYQQCMVIKKLIQLTPAFAHIHIHIVPTLRETGGLAMSSRNLLLSHDEKQKAENIFKTLQYIKQHLTQGNLQPLLHQAFHQLEQAGLEPDYVAIADAQTLNPITNWDGQQPLVALVAAFLGATRLIDNLVLTELESCFN